MAFSGDAGPGKFRLSENNTWRGLNGKFAVTVSVGPTSITGCDFGSDSYQTTGGGITTTGGQAEANNYLFSQGGGLAILINNQTLVISPSANVYFVTPEQLGGGSGGSSATEYVVNNTGGASAGYGPYGPLSVGAGNSSLTPVGQLTTTSGLQEALDAASVNSGKVIQTSDLTFTGQIIFRTGVAFDCQGYTMTCTTQMPTPFMSDVFSAMRNSNYTVRCSPGTNSCTDTVINAYNSSSITSPYTYTNNNSYYVVLLVTGGTVSQIISPNGTTSAESYGVFPVGPGQSVKVTFSQPPAVSILSGVVALGRADNQAISSVIPSISANEWRVKITTANAGNGFLGTSWWIPNDYGGTGHNNTANYIRYLICEGVIGIYGARFIGAGGSNSYTLGDSIIDQIILSGIGGGQSNVPGYGVDFAYHVDHVTIKWVSLTSASGAVAGTSLTTWNDGAFAASNVDNQISECYIQGGIFVTTNSTDYLASVGFCDHNGGSGINQFDGGSNNVVINFAPSNGQQTTYWNGYDMQNGVSYSNGQAYAAPINQGMVVGPTKQNLVYGGWDFSGTTTGSPNIGSVVNQQPTAPNIIFYSGAGYGPTTIYETFASNTRGNVLVFQGMNLVNTGIGSGVYSIIATDTNGNARTLQLTASGAGFYSASYNLPLGLSGVVQVQFENATTPWHCALSTVVVPIF